MYSGSQTARADSLLQRSVFGVVYFILTPPPITVFLALYVFSSLECVTLEPDKQVQSSPTELSELCDSEESTIQTSTVEFEKWENMAHTTGTCSADEGFVELWTGRCVPAFGIQSSLLAENPQTACESLHGYACGEYTASMQQDFGTPRAFAMARSSNARTLNYLRNVEKQRLWTMNHLSRLAAACSFAMSSVHSGTTAVGEDSVADEIMDDWPAFSSNGGTFSSDDEAEVWFGTVVARAAHAGVDSPVYVTLRQLPTDRKTRVTYVEMRIPDTVSADAPPLAVDFWTKLRLAKLSASPPPETLYAYAIRDQSPSLKSDLFLIENDHQTDYLVSSGAEARGKSAPLWIRTMTTEMSKLAQRANGVEEFAHMPAMVWAFSAEQIASLTENVRAFPEAAASYVQHQVRQAYNVELFVGSTYTQQHSAGHSSRAPTSNVAKVTREAALKLGVSPPFATPADHAEFMWEARLPCTPDHTPHDSYHDGCSDLERSVCTDFASRVVWWRMDSWFVSGQIDAAVITTVTELFDATLAATKEILTHEIDMPASVQSFLLKKADAIKLRFSARGKHEQPPTVARHGIPLKSLADELRAARQESIRRSIPRYDSDLDRHLDTTDLSLVSANAFYSATDNTLTVFPGLLGGAFYAEDVAPRVQELFSTLGTVIGHEISHAFDSRGIWYDEIGNVGFHVPENDIRTYIGSMRCIVEDATDRGVSGQETLNENFADALGVKSAYTAWSKNAGLTGMAPTKAMLAQRQFFTQFAQLWCADPDEKWARGERHSPPATRVDMAAAALQPFYSAAFECGDGASPTVTSRCN